MRRKDALGQYGEDAAARYLQGIGLTLVERNWRCDCGEIDIVAREGSTLVVCEVKTRSSLAFGSPMEAITPRKIRRMRQLASRWLDTHDIHAPHIRLDVVGVLQSNMGTPKIDHIRGVE